MDVGPFVDGIGRELAALAPVDSEGVGALVARLEPVIRSALFDALAAAVDEINRDLAPGSVALRFRGGEPNFAVTSPSPERSSEAAAGSGTPSAERGATAVVTVRMPRQLKAAIEQAAGHEGRSMDAWLVQMTSALVQQERAPCAPDRRGKRGRQHYTAWVR
ncbi:hypothetical protein ACIHFE_19260 [Streptomyces sp. NPDC052396]|uniref:hypothetical protein n=1 Tax=Streptomyces sp. NPDC052396 TaxID=3365689 RepID=UPI0037D176FD